eukprot:3170513-Rhodomonas_salina.1
MHGSATHPPPAGDESHTYPNAHTPSPTTCTDPSSTNVSSYSYPTPPAALGTGASEKCRTPPHPDDVDEADDTPPENLHRSTVREYSWFASTTTSPALA